MEPSSTAHRPQALIVAGLGEGQMLSCLISFVTILGLRRRADAGLGAPPKPDLPPEPPWRSYAVYSGALSLRHHKSSRRYP